MIEEEKKKEEDTVLTCSTCKQELNLSELVDHNCEMGSQKSVACVVCKEMVDKNDILNHICQSKLSTDNSSPINYLEEAQKLKSNKASNTVLTLTPLFIPESILFSESNQFFDSGANLSLSLNKKGIILIAFNVDQRYKHFINP